MPMGDDLLSGATRLQIPSVSQYSPLYGELLLVTNTIDCQGITPLLSDCAQGPRGPRGRRSRGWGAGQGARGRGRRGH